jgi:hypothetical protein
MTSVAEVGGGGEIINAGGGTVAEREKEFPAAVFGRISAETFVALIAIGISPVCCTNPSPGLPLEICTDTPQTARPRCVVRAIFRTHHLRWYQQLEEAVMANYNWCRNPDCGNMIEMPYACCCLDCERAAERADESRKRPAPTSKPTLSVTQARQVMADETASTYAQTCAKNQAARDARNQAW